MSVRPAVPLLLIAAAAVIGSGVGGVTICMERCSDDCILYSTDGHHDITTNTADVTRDNNGGCCVTFKKEYRTIRCEGNSRVECAFDGIYESVSHKWTQCDLQTTTAPKTRDCPNETPTTLGECDLQTTTAPKTRDCPNETPTTLGAPEEVPVLSIGEIVGIIFGIFGIILGIILGTIFILCYFKCLNWRTIQQSVIKKLRICDICRTKNEPIPDVECDPEEQSPLNNSEQSRSASQGPGAVYLPCSVYRDPDYSCFMKVQDTEKPNLPGPTDSQPQR